MKARAILFAMRFTIYLCLLSVMDASGHVGAGFVWGNNYWLGSELACRRVDSPVRVVLSDRLTKNHISNLTEIASPIPVGYKMVWAKHNSKWQLDINTFDKVGFILADIWLSYYRLGDRLASERFNGPIFLFDIRQWFT